MVGKIMFVIMILVLILVAVFILHHSMSDYHRHIF